MAENTGNDHLRMSNEESNQLTRECLRTALMKLMGSADLEDISISEIVRLAGVSRMAFYRNYGTKDALAADLWTRFADELEREFRESFTTEDRKSWYLHFFETMRGHTDYLKIILSRRSPINEKLIVDKLFPAASAEEHYYYIGRGGALFSILDEWYRSGMKESPEEMAAICSGYFVRKEAFNV